ncbi:MAG TPA: TonB family protein [Pirellulales bacterium]|jgi:TonB family protein|nr:TonB family protein [Pirellulales bacterium]
MLALIASAAVHVGGVWAAAVCVPWLVLPRIAPVESGFESIALKASIGSLGEAEEGRVSPIEVTAAIEWAKNKETTAVRLAPEPAVAARSAKRQAVTGRASKVDAEPIGDLPTDATLAKVTPVRHSFEAQPQIERDDLPALPRAALSSEMNVEFEDLAVRSEASPGSEANQGAYVDVKPVAVFNPRPPYPPALLQARVTGRVKLAVTVGIDGSVIEASIYESSGVAEFDRTSLETVRQWRFRPALRRGQPVEWTVSVPVGFVIDTRIAPGRPR